MDIHRTDNPWLTRAAQSLAEAFRLAASKELYVHGLLDRFAALELLEWGTSGKLAESLSVEEQHRLLLSLESILRVSGCTLVALDDGILVKRKGKERKLVVYPAMWKEPQQEDTVYVSNAYIKYAKPYAVQKILNF